MSDCLVALVNPPFKASFEGFPMSILYLAAALEEDGHRAEIYDYNGMNISPEAAAEEALKAKPDIIGITGTSPSFYEGMRFATEVRRLEELNHLEPRVWLLKGGYHERFGRSQDAETLRWNGVDRTFNGVVTAASGESQILEIARARATGKSVSSIPGMVVLTPTSLYSLTSKRESVTKIPHLVPARHLLRNQERYQYHGIFDGLQATQLMTYRGCQFKCSFCAIPNKEYDHDLRTVGLDIKTLVEEGYQAVFIDDGTFTVKWGRARQVCDLLKKYDLKWACQTRIDTVNEDRLKIMAESGCTYVYYGLESGSSDVLKAINKNLKMDHVKDV